jgi:DNA-binding response OmpR family regulator
MQKIRVLIIQNDTQKARQFGDFIALHGFEYQVATTRTEGLAIGTSWSPRVILCDHLLPDGTALELCKALRREDTGRAGVAVFIVMSAHNDIENVRQALGAGIQDYIVKPFQFEHVLKRIVYHCRSFRRIRQIQKSEYASLDEASLMLHLTNLILKTALNGTDMESTLFNLTHMLSLKMDGVRCSIVHCLNDDLGLVVTSNDNRGARGLRLDLNKYPEILHVRHTELMVAIENIEQDPLLSDVKRNIKDIRFNALVVAPLFRNRRFFGVLSLRLPETKSTITDNEIRFVEIVSHAASLTLEHLGMAASDEYWMMTG